MGPPLACGAVGSTFLLSVTLRFTGGKRDFAQLLRETWTFKISKSVTPCASKNQIIVLKFWTAELPCIYPPPFEGKYCCTLLPTCLGLKKKRKQALCISISVQPKLQFHSARNWNLLLLAGWQRVPNMKKIKPALVQKKRQSVGTPINISEICRYGLQGRSPKTLSTCRKLQGWVTGHCALENLLTTKASGH